MGITPFSNARSSYPTGGCVCCQSETQKSIYCERLKIIDERKKYLAKNRLCINCTRSQHRAADCKSRSTCQKCQRKHHTSICYQTNNPLLGASCNENRSVCYPVVVVVEINGVKCRALLDTGAGNSYAPSALINQLKIKPAKVERRCIEIMIGSVTKNIELYIYVRKVSKVISISKCKSAKSNVKHC